MATSLKIIPVTSSLGAHLYGKRTRGLSGDILNRSSILRCFTLDTLKNQIDLSKGYGITTGSICIKPLTVLKTIEPRSSADVRAV